MIPTTTVRFPAAKEGWLVVPVQERGSAQQRRFRRLVQQRKATWHKQRSVQDHHTDRPQADQDPPDSKDSIVLIRIVTTNRQVKCEKGVFFEAV
eukprot:3551192-Prymnesium_polylepis.1